MKTSEIQPGKTYVVRLTEQQSMVWRGCEVDARVTRAGFHYDVEYTTGSAIRGAPFHRTQRSEHPQGVEVEWDKQSVASYRRNAYKGRESCHAGRAVVNARAVKYEIGD